MEKQALIELVQRIITANSSEGEQDELIELFLKHVPDPNALDYIYGKEYEELTPEEIVDKSLSYKPFTL